MTKSTAELVAELRWISGKSGSDAVLGVRRLDHAVDLGASRNSVAEMVLAVSRGAVAGRSD